MKRTHFLISALPVAALTFGLIIIGCGGGGTSTPPDTTFATNGVLVARGFWAGVQARNIPKAMTFVSANYQDNCEDFAALQTRITNNQAFETDITLTDVVKVDDTHYTATVASTFHADPRDVTGAPSTDPTEFIFENGKWLFFGTHNGCPSP